MTKVKILVQLDKSLPYFLKEGVLTLEREFDIDLDEANHKLVSPIDPQKHSLVAVFIEGNKNEKL